MRLFHQLKEEDQHNAIQYCMQVVIEDMLEDGVQLEPFSEEDKKMKDLLVRVINDAQKLSKEVQFEFVINNKEAGPFIFDLALDMARGAYYHPDEDLVIHYETLRQNYSKNEQLESNEETDVVETIDELFDFENVKKSNHSLN